MGSFLTGSNLFALLQASQKPMTAETNMAKRLCDSAWRNDKSCRVQNVHTYSLENSNCQVSLFEPQPTIFETLLESKDYGGLILWQIIVLYDFTNEELQTNLFLQNYAN